MVIIGPKHIPDEEEEEPCKSECFNGRSQKFTIRWIKDITQNCSSPTKIDDEDGFGPSSSDYKRKGKQKGDFRPYEGQEQFNSRYFNLRQIKDATRNFSSANKIGEGGFGSVYKGVLPDKTMIAVKELSTKSTQGCSEFLNEVKFLSTMRHPNLVKLLGCCTENNQFLLVYEYMENHCLHSALFGSGNLKERLDWSTRVKICRGIAKGLAFLHEDKLKVKIVHRDIKLSNVLLDKSLNPKISDFGMAKHYEREDQMHITTQIAGTRGYMPPEYVMWGILTEKADVYSFGVVTIELMTGRRNTTYPISDETVSLVDLAKLLQKKGDLLALIDEDLKPSISKKEASTLLDLALLCTNESAKLRPTMSEVVSVFEGRATMKTPPLDSVYLNKVNSNRATTDIPVQYLNSTSPNTKASYQGNVFGPEEGLADLSSHIALEEEEVNTHTSISHGDVVSDAKDSKVEGEEDGVAVFPSHVASDEDANTHTTLHGDCVSNVKASIGKQGEDVGVVIQANAATRLEPPTWTSVCMAGTEDECELEYVEPSFQEGRFATTLEAPIWTSDFVAGTEDECELEYVEPSFQEGKLHIKCSDDEFEVGYSKWKDSLVGYLLGEKEVFNVDKEMVEQLWEVKEKVSVFSLGRGYFLFQFDCVEDKIRVLESSGLWQIKQRPLILRKWDWKLKFDIAEVKAFPVWVKIYNLPLFLWSSSFFSKVGSCLGVPLYVDQKTRKGERLDYARICIEVDARKQLLPESLDISVNGIDYQLNLEYDLRPLQ